MDLQLTDKKRKIINNNKQQMIANYQITKKNKKTNIKYQITNNNKDQLNKLIIKIYLAVTSQYFSLVLGIQELAIHLNYQCYFEFLQ